MKKSDKETNFLYTPQIENRKFNLNKAKTTDINILLNRVKLSKKIEFKKRLIFLTLLILSITLVSALSLF
tara:strand:+ start:473 stop:682 length:210 start_codon:yes stop_codon:yes gene_type:complete